MYIYLGLQTFLSTNREKMIHFVSFDFLPEDFFVIKVFSHVATTFLFSIQTPELVLKSFIRLCNDAYVLYHFPFHKLSLSPWVHNHEHYSKFLKKCCKNRNPETIYRKGFINYFYRNSDKQWWGRGLKHLAKVVDKKKRRSTTCLRIYPNLSWCQS